jgi:hypothetical protein
MALKQGQSRGYAAREQRASNSATSFNPNINPATDFMWEVARLDPATGNELPNDPVDAYVHTNPDGQGVRVQFFAVGRYTVRVTIVSTGSMAAVNEQVEADLSSGLVIV